MSQQTNSYGKAPRSSGGFLVGYDHADGSFRFIHQSRTREAADKALSKYRAMWARRGDDAAQLRVEENAR